ncbi:MAG: LysM peptidoglycan-binding domain-containing protein [Sterolibacteriaceae bacterium]|nr:LysM peptidoglycan-binding domain-containing protein [Sterolibacteriaceae bacterium]
MNMTFRARILAAAIAALPLTVNAAGLGRLSVMSALGQPLRAEVELSASREELSSLSARLASPETFKQAGIEYAPALSSLKFKVDRRPNGQAVLKISSDRPINDPFLDVMFELNWANGRLVREYTFLLDPADAGKPRDAVAPTAPAAPVASTPTTAPSDAKPASAPASSTAAPAASGPKSGAAAGGAYTVRRGDTLSKIAGENLHYGVSVEQMLVALYNRNQDAFEGNMNRLKAGKILSIPDREAATAVAQPEARRIVSAQVADFNVYRGKLAAAAKAAPAAPSESQQAAGGKIAPKVDERAPAAAPGQDQVKVSKTEAGKDGKADPKLTQKIAQLEEDVVAKDRALKEANSRVSDLQKNVEELKKLVELKNQDLAAVQQQAAAAKKPAVPEKPAAPVEPPKSVEAAKPAELAKPVEAAKPVEPPKPVEATKPAEPAKPVEMAKPAETAAPPAVAEAKPEPKPEPPKPAAKPAPKPTEPTEPPGFFSELLDNPATLIGGGGLLALLVGWGVVRARNRSGGAEPSLPAPSIAPSTHSGNSVFGTAGGQSVDTSSQIQTDFSQSAMTAIDADEGVDPVAEADVYMAYGRDAQAEEILLDALKNEPTRHAIHVKLLEIYAQRKNAKQFENLATQLYGLTSGSGADWEKAAAMGAAFDPDNPLYGASKNMVRTEVTHDAATQDPVTISLAGHTEDEPTVVLSSAQKMKDTWTMPGELSQITRAVEGGDEQTTVVLPGEPEAPAPKIDALDKLDFDLDLGGGEEPAANEQLAADEASALAAAAAAAQTTYVGMDSQADPGAGIGALDFELTTQPHVPLADDAAEQEDVSVIDLTATQPNEVAALDFNLDSISSSTRSSGSAFADPNEPMVDLEKTDAGGTLVNFDFELGDTRAQAPLAPPSDIDLSEVSVDLPPEQQASAMTDDDALLGAEETNTKLELARAYEEMGDREGARELLGEVLKEGTSEQQAKARDLLSKLA